MRRFYAPKEQIQADSVVLGPDETRHLRDVLRLRDGAFVGVFDGEGREYRAEIVQISRAVSKLRIIKQVPPSAPESSLDMTLAVALLKGEKFDLVVQKAVELGVSRLVPVLTMRGDVKPKDTQKRTERWRRIGLEASKQSGRARLMQIDEPVGFIGFIKGIRAAESSQLFLFSERGGEGLPHLKAPQKITALVGPEGGWDDAEIEPARQAGFSIITLGGRILRAETAAISIAAILQHRFGDVN